MNYTKIQTELKKLFYGTCILIVLLGQSSISLAQDDAWTKKAPMPTARFWFSCEVVNGKIYAIGGATAADAPTLATVEEYDPVTNTWTTKTDMPTARCNMASAVLDGKIYIVGGDKFFKWGVAAGEQMLEVYDPATDTWDTTKTGMPTAREGVSACVVDSIIYVIGGVAPGGVACKDVEAYDPATDTWATKAPMPTGRWALSTEVVDGKIYAMGTGQVGKTVEEYDPATDTWTTKASMLVGNGYFGTCVDDGIIYTLGGASGITTQYSRVFTYNPLTDEWSEKTAMSAARMALGTGVVNKKIYAIGGSAGSSWSPLSTNEECALPMTSVGIEDVISPTSFVLQQNYPNPFNSETTLTYQLQQPETIQFIIYNQIGEKTETIRKWQSTGKHQFIWNAEGLPSGVYYCVFKTKSQIQTMKMIKL
jgi:hypothetical protein